MFSAFLTFINDYIPDISSRKTLLAVSGGVDSMVMCELFRQAGFSFAIAHCNFGLRGEKSDQDEQFVKLWAEQYQVESYFHRFDTQAAANQQSISIQMAARNLRYAWFDELLQNHGFDYLATAHHTNDLLETTLLNLVRGTGFAGLPGILPLHGHLIRPLLFATKQEIVDFAREQQIAWREDSSNESDYYRRNLLRHQVVPVLQSINPSLEATFRLTAERLSAANTLLKVYLSKWKEQTLRQEGESYSIPIESVRQAPEPVLQLHFLLEAFGYSYAQTKQIVASLTDISGKLFYSADYQLLKDRTELIIDPIDRDTPAGPILISESDHTIPLSGTITLEYGRLPEDLAFNPSSNRDVAYFDENLVHFPLTIRPWQEGDWFCPFGMRGKRKKVSDLLVDEKVPLSRKKECLVMLTKDQRIMWVLGIRSDERFRVRAESKRILYFRISK